MAKDKTLDQVAAAYEARVAAVPEVARRFAEETWGKTWAHAEMGALLDFAALAAPTAKGGTVLGGDYGDALERAASPPSPAGAAYREGWYAAVTHMSPPAGAAGGGSGDLAALSAGARQKPDAGIEEIAARYAATGKKAIEDAIATQRPAGPGAPSRCIHCDAPLTAEEREFYSTGCERCMSKFHAAMVAEDLSLLPSAPTPDLGAQSGSDLEAEIKRLTRCNAQLGRDYEEMCDRAKVALLLSDAAIDVLRERQRQFECENYTYEHDDAHSHGEMAWAAACYVLHAAGMRRTPEPPIPHEWPWAQEYWKPTTPRRDLVKASALILAEIERLDRASKREAGANDVEPYRPRFPPPPARRLRHQEVDNGFIPSSPSTPDLGAQSDEPFAYAYEMASRQEADGTWTSWCRAVDRAKPGSEFADGQVRYVTPLYPKSFCSGDVGAIDRIDYLERQLAACDPDLGAQGEPVAWAYEELRTRTFDEWEPALSYDRPGPTSWFRNIEPLFKQAPATPRTGSGVSVDFEEAWNAYRWDGIGFKDSSAITAFQAGWNAAAAAQAPRDGGETR